MAGAKLKVFWTWSAPNTGATNESGFTGLSGVMRDKDGAYLLMGTHCTWWSKDIFDASQAWYLQLVYNAESAGIFYYYYPAGTNVRCIKD